MRVINFTKTHYLCAFCWLKNGFFENIFNQSAFSFAGVQTYLSLCSKRGSWCWHVRSLLLFAFNRLQSMDTFFFIYTFFCLVFCFISEHPFDLFLVLLFIQRVYQYTLISRIKYIFQLVCFYLFYNRHDIHNAIYAGLQTTGDSTKI